MLHASDSCFCVVQTGRGMDGTSRWCGVSSVARQAVSLRRACCVCVAIDAQMARDHAAALAEMRGGKKCPAIAKEELMAGTSFWSVADMPVDGIDEKELDDTLKLWQLVFEECAGDHASKTVASQSEFFRFGCSCPRVTYGGQRGTRTD